MHPSTTYKDGKIKINYRQRIPYNSTDIREDPEEYSALSAALANLFEWIRLNVSLRNQFWGLS